MVVWPSYQVEIMVKPVMMFSLCWPSDPGWIMVNPSLCL